MCILKVFVLLLPSNIDRHTVKYTYSIVSLRLKQYDQVRI